jgi:hypothetical protein
MLGHHLQVGMDCRRLLSGQCLSIQPIIGIGFLST